MSNGPYATESDLVFAVAALCITILLVTLVSETVAKVNHDKLEARVKALESTQKGTLP